MRTKGKRELVDDTIVYLWDDFTVVKSPVLADQGVLWKNVIPEWKIFCQETLQFEIPVDLHYAYEQKAQEQRAANASKEMREKSASSGKGG